ncbi:putative isoprenylcysteine alpha-carbonyl methylesterase ICMEL1 [Citrus sinensis]|uniref:Isoprenylcysteine alpha-carbonyl methylesterase ICMEL1 n=2 Tax=Citrus sinensis TaxID=2711 RepID=A0ACB8LG60_CITSI|nr:putative isoprenylcysteine alpha-carbonyl methylesterase ICMEL1 [Citrus sinensis]KDO70138.1 hypothetical protein CISIN_1g011866mg [Citrus sinensis]
MPSQILPVTHHHRGTEAAAMLIKAEIERDDPTTSLLISSEYEDVEKAITSIKPVLSRTSSYNNNNITSPNDSPGLGNCYQQRRRRSASDNSLSSLSGSNGSGAASSAGGSRRHSFSKDVGRAAAETFLVTRLSFKLLRYLGVGYRWIVRFLALGCYSLLLLPGFIQVGCHYFFSSQVRRGIVYGDQPRNRLDLYFPKSSDGPKPVVAFITGGAWIIGYKAWGSLLGQQLSERDIIVACIDYRNFPQGTIKDMVKDASQGISFVCNNISEYGGDPDRIYLMGQSAGAHIAACTLLEQAIKETGEGESTTWSVSQIRAYFGLSGGIMDGEESLRQYSPEVLVQDPNTRHAVSLLPPIILFHGTADYSIPADASKNFANTLQRVGVRAESILYEGKTHTDLFLQDPMRGGKDDMFEDIVAIIHADDQEARAKDAVAPPRRRLVPEFMLKLARSISPF